MDWGTVPSSIAVELVTLVIRNSSYFSVSRRWGLVSFSDLTSINSYYHETTGVFHRIKFRGHNTNFFDPDGVNGNMAIIFRRSLSWGQGVRRDI